MDKVSYNGFLSKNIQLKIKDINKNMLKFASKLNCFSLSKLPISSGLITETQNIY